MAGNGNGPAGGAGMGGDCELWEGTESHSGFPVFIFTDLAVHLTQLITAS